MNLVELEGLSEFWEETPEPPAREDYYEITTDSDYDFETEPKYIVIPE